MPAALRSQSIGGPSTKHQCRPVGRDRGLRRPDNPLAGQGRGFWCGDGGCVDAAAASYGPPDL